MPRFSMPGASERLSQSNVELERILLREQSLGRHGDVESDVSNGRVIAYAYAGTDAELGRHRFQTGADLSGIHEYRGAKVGAEALPQFQTTGLDRGAADRESGARGADGKFRPHRLILIAANSAAAAPIESLIRRQAQFPRPLGNSGNHACRQHRAAGIRGQQMIQVEIRGGFDLIDEKF